MNLSFPAAGQSSAEQLVSANTTSTTAPLTLDAKWTGFNMGTFTVPHPPVSTSDQQQTPSTTGAAPASGPLTASTTDKKTKGGKKSKAASIPTQQAYSASDASGKQLDNIISCSTTYLTNVSLLQVCLPED